MKTQLLQLFALTFLLATSQSPLAQAAAPERPGPGDPMIADYFRAETAQLSERCLAGVKTLADWTARREQYRQQLFEMLGLSPLPERTPLNPVVTGKTDSAEFAVENLHFQSRPGLYVTANLYLPKVRSNPAPAVLYVCGHSRVLTNGVSFGNKTAYQHHGAWFARHGYVCLTIDTLQLGEIQGLHHGTYREGMWWWNARGYTPAGVEAWNCVRALDYLQSRPEVDANRLGVTGRSGGGAYSWWLAALDERIKVAAPVAGITDLQNHVVDGCVEGHCDCMFIVNTYRWDYPLVAALVAPRALLIANSDKDSIFLLDGVIRVHAKARKIYELYGATQKLGLLIAEGPHRDTQDLQLPVFRWFNRHLKGEDPLITNAATKFFRPEQLRVFKELPTDQRNTKIQEIFVPPAQAPVVPVSKPAWTAQCQQWIAALQEKSFGGWPVDAGPLEARCLFTADRHGICLEVYEYSSQPKIRLRLYLARRAGLDRPELTSLHVLDEGSWPRWLSAMRFGFAGELREEVSGTVIEAGPPASAVELDMEKTFAKILEKTRSEGSVLAWMAPRGVGPTSWSQGKAKPIQVRRRFMLLGQTLDGMRVWDIRRAIQVLRQVNGLGDTQLCLKANGQMGVNALYAALFEPGIARLDLWELPMSHQAGPDYLNVLRVLDIPQAAAIVAGRTPVRLHQTNIDGWGFPKAVAAELQWSSAQFEVFPAAETATEP